MLDPKTAADPRALDAFPLVRYFGVPITKAANDPNDPDVVYVEGPVTGGAVDFDGQILDPDFTRRSLDEWMHGSERSRPHGNIRQQHSQFLPPAGKAVWLDHRNDGSYIRGKIVEPVAVKLVREGVYQDFSIGVAAPKFVYDPRAPKGRCVDGRTVEVSITDYGAYPESRFKWDAGELTKSASGSAGIRPYLLARDPWLDQAARVWLDRLSGSGPYREVAERLLMGGGR